MRQPWFTIGDDLVVRNDAGEVVYKVDGKLLSFRSSATIWDREGREVVSVREVLLTLDATSTLERNREPWGAVKLVRGAPDLKERFAVESKDDASLVVRDTGFQEYRVERGSSCVAMIVKAQLGIRESYDITISAGEDEGLVLGITVAIRQLTRRSLD
jgi:uncharacterized protein YxjI